MLLTRSIRLCIAAAAAVWATLLLTALQAEDNLPAGAVARFGSPRLQHGRNVTWLKFSRDGKKLYSAGRDFTTRIWDLQAGQELRTFYNYACQMQAAALSPDEKLIVVATHNIGVLVRRTDSGELFQRLLGGATTRALAFTPDGRTLLLGGDYGLKWWDVETQKYREGMDAAKHRVSTLTVSPGGKCLAVTGGPIVQLMDCKTGKSKRDLVTKDGDDKHRAVAFSRDGRYVAATSHSSSGKSYVWDLQAKDDKPITSLAKRDDEGRLLCAAFSADGTTVITGGNELTVWDWKKQKVKFELSGHHGPVGAVAVSPDGKILASGGSGEGDVKNYAIRLWNLETGKEMALHPHVARGALTGLAVAGDGRRFVATGADRRATVWDVRMRKPVCQIHRPDAYSRLRVALSPDGKRFATDAEVDVTLWDAATGQAVSRLKGGEERKRCVSFSPDSKYLAAGGINGSVFVWDVERRKLVNTFKADAGDILSVDFSPDGETLLVSNEGGMARLWSAATGKPLLEREDHGWMLRDMAFSNHGMRVAGVSDDHVISICEVATGKLVHKFKTDWSMMGVAFCGRGRVVAVGRADDWLDFWDLATGQRFHRQKNRLGVQFAAVVPSPDGRTMYTACSDSTVLQWDLAPILAKLPDLGPPPTAIQRAAYWKQLTSPNPAHADEAIWRLAAGGDATVEFLREKLAPPHAEELKPEAITKLIRELDDDEFSRRERAFAELAELGSAATPHLKKAEQETESAEVRFRVRTLIARAQRGGVVTGWTAEQLQAARARQVLAYLDTPAARKLLESISPGRN